MTRSVVTDGSTLPPVTTPSALVFCDFDETFWCHERDHASRRELARLIDVVVEAAAHDGVVFGWVTGSSLEDVVLRMAEERIDFRPHFVGSDLGTVLTIFDEDGARTPPAWTALLDRSGFSQSIVADIVDAVGRERGVTLRPQRAVSTPDHLSNYYLTSFGETEDHRAITAIQRFAFHAGVGVNINRCNPRAGDPADCFDVDFYPTECGKRAVVRFMQEHYRIGPDRCAAFGDSGNDLPMLAAVRHGWLVSNATPEARRNHHRVTAAPYSAGILHGLHEFVVELRERDNS